MSKETLPTVAGKETGFGIPAPMVGTPAPFWAGTAYQRSWDGEGFRELSLSDYEGKWLVFFFYPLDFTFVCPTEITAYNEALADFARRNAEVVGVSVDSKHSHRAWVASGTLGELAFPLLADITKQISADYQVLLPEGFSLRGLFIVDPEGVLQYSVVHNTDVGRSVEETLRVLDALQSGGLCPANWKKGESTLSAGG